MADPSLLAVICNQHARSAARDPMLPDRLRRIVNDAGLVRTTWDVSEIPDAVLAFRRAGASLVAVCGGDGALMRTLSALRAEDGPLPRVVTLPAGTVNTVARSLGIGQGPEATLRRLVACIERSAPLTIVERDTLEVSADGRIRVGFIFGAGLVSSFFELYNQSSGAGRIWAAGQIARIFAGSFVGGSFASRIIAPVPVRITVDGRLFPLDRFTLVLASTLEDVGLGLRVTYRATEVPGTFHLVGTDLPASRLGPQLPRVLLGRRLRAEPLLDVVTTAASLQFEAPAGRFLLDGELEEASQVSLRIGPRIGFIVP